MNEALVRRVKNSLNAQHYTMNDSWLSDCIEYYLNDNANATQQEIITFVMNQWVLYDLKEINNDNGCLPRNLAQQKSTTLPGKYILQMNKMYDISQSKYKQLEKIRNVSSENVEATENENINQDDKFQNYEPKSKRMLQLFLTDGIQDVLAIEYKPIRFLKSDLLPGFKVMIKGPVKCRKGVILLEENNISEVGGEVDSLLITNAVENVFARALNLEENPDPYNDTNKQNKNVLTQSTQRTTQINDDFDIDAEMIDQIDKQIQQQNPAVSNNSVISSTANKSSQVSVSSNNTVQSHNNINNNKIQSSIISTPRNQQNIQCSITPQTKTQNNSKNLKNSTNTSNFEDDGDLFLEMVDDKAFEDISTSKFSFAVPRSVPIKQSVSSKTVPETNVDDFPMDDEIFDLTRPIQKTTPCSIKSKSSIICSKDKNVYDLTKESPPSTSNTFKMNSFKKSPYNSNEMKSKDISHSDKNSFSSKSIPNKISCKNADLLQKPQSSNISDFPNDEFNLDDVDMEADDINDYVKKDNKFETSKAKSSQTSSSSLKKLETTNINTNDALNQIKNSNHSSSSSSSSALKKLNFTNLDTKNLSNHSKNSKISVNSSTETKFNSNNSSQNLGSEFEDEFNDDFELIPNMNYKSYFKEKMETVKVNDSEKLETASVKSENSAQNNSIESTRTKRLGSKISPTEEIPQKVRCLQSTPKTNKNNERKITDFLSTKSESSSLLDSNELNGLEFITDILRVPVTEPRVSIVRGKVTKVVKLNLLKNEKGSYFYLEGSITDNTANLDVIFSSKVIEKIVGYSPQEFSQKRKQSKTDPSIKDQLKEDLKKAQEKLTKMDELMEIKFRSNEKPLVKKCINLTNEGKKFIDEKVKLLKS